MQLIPSLVGRFECSDLGQVGMQHDARDPILLWLHVGRQTGQLNKAKSVEREFGFPLNRAARRSGVRIGRFRITIILRVYRAVGVEHFGKTKHRGLVFLDRDIQFRPTHHVLSKIKDKPSRHTNRIRAMRPSNWIPVRFRFRSIEKTRMGWP